MDNAIAKGLKVIQKKISQSAPKGALTTTTPGRSHFTIKEIQQGSRKRIYPYQQGSPFNHEYYDALTALDYAFRTSESLCSMKLSYGWQEHVSRWGISKMRIVLDRYDALGDAPASTMRIMATYADYLIRSGQYNSAIPFVAAAAEGPVTSGTDPDATTSWPSFMKKPVALTILKMRT